MASKAEIDPRQPEREASVYVLTTAENRILSWERLAGTWIAEPKRRFDAQYEQATAEMLRYRFGGLHERKHVADTVCSDDPGVLILRWVSRNQEAALRPSVSPCGGLACPSEEPAFDVRASGQK